MQFDSRAADQKTSHINLFVEYPEKTHICLLSSQRELNYRGYPWKKYYELGTFHSIFMFLFFFRSLGENPLHCDCKLQWLRGRLLGANNQFPYIRHIENLKCSTPSRLQGRTLVNLSEEVLCGKTSECSNNPKTTLAKNSWYKPTMAVI